MNWLDILLCIVLAAGAFFGLRRGFVQSVTGLLGAILAVVVAGNFYSDLGGTLNLFSPAVSNIIAFMFILLIVLTVTYLVGRLLKFFIKTVFSGWIDPLAGGVAGLLFAGVVMSAILATWAKFFGGGLLANSVISQALLDGFPVILGLLPGEFDTIREFFQESSQVIDIILGL